MLQFLTKNSLSLFKLHLCSYLCDKLFLVKTLKKRLQSRITKFLFVVIDFSGPINPGIVFICSIYQTEKDNFCMHSSTQNPLKGWLNQIWIFQTSLKDKIKIGNFWFCTESKENISTDNIHINFFLMTSLACRASRKFEKLCLRSSDFTCFWFLKLYSRQNFKFLRARSQNWIIEGVDLVQPQNAQSFLWRWYYELLLNFDHRWQ
jgi:hypothetical protein